MTDLSKLSNEDLLAIQSGDMSKVSTAGLQHLAGDQPAPQAAPAPRQATPAPQSTDKDMGRVVADSLQGMLTGGPVAALVNASMGKDRVNSMKDGVMTGAASIGNTLLTPARWAADKIEPKQATIKTLVTGEKTRPDTFMGGVADYLERSPEAAKSFDKQHEGDMLYGGAKLGTQMALTAPVGGAAGQLVSKAIPFAGPAAPFLKNLAAAIESGGMRTGANPATMLAKAGDMATRVAGGAVNGGLTAGLVDPESAGAGAVIGGVLPPVVSGVANVGSTVGRFVKAAAEPLNQKNDAKILSRFLQQNMGEHYDEAAKSLRDYAATGPAIPGYQATTAEVARVPSLAALQRTSTATDPVAMNQLYKNIAPKNQDLIANTIKDMAGRDGAADFARTTRDTLANQQYGAAYAKPIDPNDITPWIKGQMTRLQKSPHVQQAMEEARKLAQTEGVDIASPEGSLRGLHYVKKELDLMIDEARHPNEARIIGGARDRLVEVIKKMSPDYAQAMAEYAANSAPVNQFDVLERVAQQAINPKGNVTLNAFGRAATDKTAQTVLRNPKATLAGVLSPEQMQKADAIRSLLEGVDFAQTAGRGVGSDTVQKIATAGMMPGKTAARLVSAVPGGSFVGGLVGRGVEGVYSNANQRIGGKLADALLHPDEALKIMETAYAKNPAGVAAQLQQLLSGAIPGAVRAAPVLAAGQ